jgi:Cdc6-related protein, AAA superfamily ATPase
VFDQLRCETSTKAIYINCWQYDTRSSLLTELLIEMGYPAPRKGRPVDEILSRLQEFIGKSRSGVAVALDEFDRLGDQTEVVYDLEMLSTNIEKDLGLVMVSNRGPRQVRLDPRSESRLNCLTLDFDPYSEAELVDILDQRVTQAFRPGVVEDGVVEVIAEQVASDSGDCREALGRLLNFGRWADRNGLGDIGVEQYSEFRNRG